MSLREVVPPMAVSVFENSLEAAHLRSTLFQSREKFHRERQHISNFIELLVQTYSLLSKITLFCFIVSMNIICLYYSAGRSGSVA